MITDMNSFSNNTLGTKGFVYFPYDNLELQNRREEQEDQNISNDMLDKLLKTIGREVLREKTPNLQELEQLLQDISTSHDSNNNNNKSHNQQQERNQSAKV